MFTTLTCDHLNQSNQTILYMALKFAPHCHTWLSCLLHIVVLQAYGNISALDSENITSSTAKRRSARSIVLGKVKSTSSGYTIAAGILGLALQPSVYQMRGIVERNHFIGSGSSKVVGGMLLHTTRRSGNPQCAQRFSKLDFDCETIEVDETLLTKDFQASLLEAAALSTQPYGVDPVFLG